MVLLNCSCERLKEVLVGSERVLMVSGMIL